MIVSTIALFVVLSVFSGLKDFSLSFIRTSDPDLKITSAEGKSFHFNDSVRDALLAMIESGLGQILDEHAKEAWTLAYDQITE